MKLFDLHCDTLYKAFIEDLSNKSNYHVSIKKGLKYFPWFQCFAVWIPDEIRGDDAFDLFCRANDRFLQFVRDNPDKLTICKNMEDLVKVNKSNICGAILTVEGGAVLGGDIKRLTYLHNCGVKMITLTWNGECELGFGSGCDNSVGLLPFGKDVINEMQRLNMTIDISHANDKLFYDTVKYFSGPVIASHSNSRKVFSHKRNLTDDQFNIIKSRGGLVGINFSEGFLNGEKKSTMYDILKHVDHFLSLGGQDVVCIGSDFDGTDIPGDMAGIESMGKLYGLFLSNGYNEETVDKIFFKNAYSFFSKRFT